MAEAQAAKEAGWCVALDGASSRTRAPLAAWLDPPRSSDCEIAHFFFCLPQGCSQVERRRGVHQGFRRGQLEEHLRCTAAAASTSAQRG